ncbi:DUF4129 domain-containing protein [Haladaptatus sp. DYF46]|uniref:DUF4129 domain-containing protein n=1 Tax=Haladaptatus sp. DYF46 TaxID=2886041 RepID=UPI001E5284FB|nr:DUF4129 domain-containing protein [Haladaptatus sp. DYF46]
MNTDRLLTAGIALCCIFAIGTSASTLGTSVHTNPDDVIDVNYKSLPIKPTEADQLKHEAQSKGSPTASQANSHSAAQQKQKKQRKRSSAKERKRQSKSQSSWKRLEFVDRILELLRELVRVLAWVVPIAILVGGVAVGVRFRNRLSDAVETETTPDAGPASPQMPNPDPSNEIERAWWSMVERFGVDRPHTKTPGECAREAIDAGGDEEAVRTLTRTFEEVRYGGEPVTDDRLDRIRHGTDRLGGA